MSVEVRKIYCLGCGYHLHGLSTSQCPECGRPFDARDSDTFARSARPWPRNAVFILPVVIPLILSAVFWAHVAHTQAGDPLGEGFDLALFFVCILLKVATIMSLACVLGMVYAAMASRPDVARRTFLLWLACSLVVTLAWAGLRERAAPIIRNDAIRYLTMSDVPETEQDRLDFHRRWPRGLILLEELGLAVVLGYMHTRIGLRLGRHAAAAAALGAVATVLLLVAHVFVFRLVDLDYDFFHADIFSGALAFDLIYFFAAVDPYTTIACTVYVPFVLTSLWIVRHYGMGSDRSPSPT